MNLNLNTLRRIFTTLTIVGVVAWTLGVFEKVTRETPPALSLDVGLESQAPKVVDETRKPCRLKKPKLEGIHQVGPFEYEVERAEIETALASVSATTGSRIVPAFEEGKPIGFKLFSIRPGSQISRAGFQNGDVFLRFNGQELNAPDKALKVYREFKQFERLSVEIMRRGEPLTLTYKVIP